MNIRLGLVSAYSFLCGVHLPHTLLDRAAAYGIKTVSICDIDNLYGVHSFLEAAKERGITPIIGAALKTISGSIVYCFVENRTGFGNLCEIISERNKDKENFDPLPFLREKSQGLVIASSCPVVLQNLRGLRLYAAVSPNDLRAVNSAFPLAFIDNSIFLEKDDFTVHRVLCAIKHLKTVGNLEKGDTEDPGRVFKESKDLRSFLSSWPEAVKGTNEIAALCTFNDLFNGWIFPGWREADAAQELERRVYEGNAARYGELADRETGRIDYELEIINKKGFASYFLVIDDIVRMASRTCGRGSGAASIVSYGLAITNVDPLRYNLYFERFLNPVRPDPPDLDVDFAWDERDDLIKAVIEKYGSAFCARVANHNMFRYRSALRETAKAYGFGDAEVSQMERRIQLETAKNVLEESENYVWREIFNIAVKIEGLPRGLGMHCGGVVITPQPVNRYVPIEKSAEGYPLMAWEKEGAEAAGFVKIDLLGNRSLAVIRDAVANINEQITNSVDDIQLILNRAVDDKETIMALARGDSMGVFYIESPAMRQLQKKSAVGDFDHIVIHSSIIRPAANKYINEYVRRLKGGKWQPLHPRLEKILNESYGILCYQEDVSKTAVALANFNEADADKLRKVIAKKMGGAKLGIYKDQFFNGCRGNGVNEDTIQKIWEMMLSFDGYSFCKPHSASYAMVSFQSAYLRVHHPAEFMAAVLSNQGGFYRPHAYIAEVRRMGLVTEGPDINLSQWKYYGASQLANEQLRTEGLRTFGSAMTPCGGNRGTVVIGFMAIKGLSVSGVKMIMAEREAGGDFLSLEDFAKRVRLGRDDIVALCPAGVFDSIAAGIPRPLQARYLLQNISNSIKNNKNGELFITTPVFPDGVSGNLMSARSDIAGNHQNSLWDEYEALGFLRNIHPLALWKEAVLSVKNRVKALHIGDYAGKSVKMVGWPVTQKDVWTKEGQTMCFLSLEDETALYETVVFPQVFNKYNKLLFDQRPLLVYGKVVNDHGAISLEVQRLETLG